MTLNKWEQSLYDQYKTKDLSLPAKSHWKDCDWATSKAPVLLFSDAPPYYISCNACLRRRGYIRIIPCNPRLTGWPHRQDCENCDYGLDCETWLRVKGIGEGAEEVLRLLDPGAFHPVTWEDADMVPFSNGDIYFSSKDELQRYTLDLLIKYGIRAWG